MAIKWDPPSEEELAARGVGHAAERARLDDGTFKADNPVTPNVDEAWVKKPRRKKEG